eukprot:4542053-Amphidinium_carterae.2
MEPVGPESSSGRTHDRRALQAGLDLFGDLHELEAACPPSRPSDLPACVSEEVISGVLFRSH